MQRVMLRMLKPCNENSFVHVSPCAAISSSTLTLAHFYVEVRMRLAFDGCTATCRTPHHDASSRSMTFSADIGQHDSPGAETNNNI